MALETMLSAGDKHGDRFRMRRTIDWINMGARLQHQREESMQMNRRRLLRGIVFVGVFALVVGVSAAQAQTVLKFSHTDNPGGSRQDAAEFFGKKVEQYTQGRYKVQVFPSGQLANDPKAIEMLQLGGVDFTVTATGSYATHLRSLNLSALPFLVDTYEQGWKLYDESKWFESQFAQLPAKGFRVLSTFEAGFRSFTTKMPLNSPEDAKGKKMRIYPNDMIRWIMEAIGFSPVVLPVTEVYLAIQQGTVIGQENPIDTIYSLRFYEVAPNITLTQHVYSPIPLTISEATWKKFSDADKAAVKKAADEAAAFSRSEVKGAEARQLKEMEAKGAKILRPNIEPFRAAVQPVYAKAKEAYGQDVDQLLAEAQAIRKALPAK
jgi:tripartite ATP-independent transporter DctP family solute receptor